MTSRVFRILAPLLVVGFIAFSFHEAAARAGGGRSFGSRGSSSYRSSSRPAPAYGSSSSQRNPSGVSTPFGQGQSGGFLRSLGGGILGGMVGGMLFRSLGFAGTGLGGGGGIGLFEIALLAGGGYLLYRFVAARRNPAPARAQAGSPFFGQIFGGGEPSSPRPGVQEVPGWGPAATIQGVGEGLSQLRQRDPGFDEARFRDTAQDIFFRVQGAWTRRDLASVEDLLGDEVRRTLQSDLEGLKSRGEINRLENIAVREAEIVEAWQEQGQDFLTLRLLASLLDYTTDERGAVQSGSDREPVKFEEYWTFGRPIGSGAWKLTGIQQTA